MQFVTLTRLKMKHVFHVVSTFCWASWAGWTWRNNGCHDILDFFNSPSWSFNNSSLSEKTDCIRNVFFLTCRVSAYCYYGLHAVRKISCLESLTSLSNIKALHHCQSLPSLASKSKTNWQKTLQVFRHT